MIDLSKLSLAEIRSLQEQLVEEMARREQEEVAKAREQILAIAKNVGLPLKELIGDGGQAKPGKARAKAAARYRHPSDASLQWGGRGRQPQWVKDWISSGKSIDTLRV